MQVLLTTLNSKYIHLNLAIRLLYALNRHHPGLKFREFVIKENPHAVAEACSGFDVVAFSCYIWNITQTLEVARLLKQINPQIKILLGGPEVSYDYTEFIQRPEVDYIICGEGEIPFAAFMNHFPDVHSVPNLAYKENGLLRFNAQQVNFDLNDYAGINPYAFDNTEELKNKVADRKSTRLNSSHVSESRMPSSA